MDPSACDFALLWGRPEMRVTGRWVSLSWPEQHVTGTGWLESGRFSYFLARNAAFVWVVGSS